MNLDTMKKVNFYIYGSLAVFVWILMTFAIFVHRPDMTSLGSNSNNNKRTKQNNNYFQNLTNNIENYAKRMDKQMEENQALLETVESLKKDLSSPPKSGLEGLEGTVIPILMFACNRVTVGKAIDQLIKYRRPERAGKFPIIVSQDCNHKETEQVILGYQDNITFIQQPDQSEPQVPKAEKKFKGYFKISRHYGWALNRTLAEYDQVIVVEDDLEFSPDFFEYFESTLPLLRKDKSLWCVSAWNDNGKKTLIDTERPDLLYRTDFFGGLGWMLTRELWVNELMAKWPRSYWDDWMRRPEQRKNRACIRPEVPRTKTFGKIGVSNGLFFDKHLKYIHLNDKFFPFKSKDMAYLLREHYDKDLAKMIHGLPAVSLTELKSGPSKKEVKLFYKTKADFKAAVKVLGIMDDAKSGVPRMAYKGIISTMYYHPQSGNGTRVYLTPGLNWKGYNPTW